MKILSLILAIASGAAMTSPFQQPNTPSAASRLPFGIWIDRHQTTAPPANGAAWRTRHASLRRPCGTPTLSLQDDRTNVCVLGKALLFVWTAEAGTRLEVAEALRLLLQHVGGERRALALGRKLAAYVIAADLIDLKIFDPGLDRRFREAIKALLTMRTVDGPIHLIDCHERRPNNWGTHCGASRAAVAAYLGDARELARVAQVFKGYLGDRSAYVGFAYGSDRSWQCNPETPVAINPKSCTRDGHSIDGVLPDDQRRGGSFTWPPPKENYVYEALQGALVQAVILNRAGYESFAWQDEALLRAFQWLHAEAEFPAEGDDTWQPHVVNHYYETTFPAPIPSRPGKNVGWTDWTHGRAD